MSTPHLDAFDQVAHAEVFEARLAAAVAELAQREDVGEEKAWLEAAHRHVARAREGVGTLLTRVLRLPDLEPVKGERGRALQGAAVDAIDALFVAISAAAGERSPLLDVLYRDVKTPLARRYARDAFAAFCDEIEKRIGSTYAKRMFADETYAVAAPELARVRGAIYDWRLIFTSEPLTDGSIEVLGGELETFARRLEMPCRQARFLAEAALLPYPDLLESSAVLDRPKRRPRRDAT